MPVYGINQTCGGAADCFKRAFQFCKFFSAAPPGDIPKRIVRRIKPVMLADRIGDAFCLYLAGAAVGAFRRVFVYVMECRVGNFMDCGLDVLQFVHALVDDDTLFLIIAASLYAAAQGFKGNVKRGSPFKGSEKILILFHVARKLLYPKVGQLFTLGLRHVKNRYHTKGGDLDFLFLGNGFPVLIENRLLGVRVDFFHLFLNGKRGRCKYLDSFFSGLYMAVKFLFPLLIAFHKVATLHGDKDCIVKAVIVKL